MRSEKAVEETPTELAQLVAEFEQNGFCTVKSVLSASEITTMRDAVMAEQRLHPQHYRLLGQSRDGGPIGEHGRWQSSKIAHVTDIFDPLIAHPRVLPLVQMLLGPDEVACVMHGPFAGVRDPPARSAPIFGETWPEGTATTAPWPGGGILWQRAPLHCNGSVTAS